ncbi:MAG: segregation/condensation protein A [Anaerolineales bacterium]|nr:segregation/condensation protein A [Anaerolineales bacterium]
MTISANTEAYTIHLPVYEGPLDLLLSLIENAELDITRIALAAVTDQYLAYMRQMQEVNLENLAAFMVIAARLIQIKSEALLPRPPEREQDEEDPGDALARQLILYRRFKQIAATLEQREALELRNYLRQAPLPYVEPKLDLTGANINDLRSFLLEMLKREHSNHELNQSIVPEEVSIRDRIHVIIGSVRKFGRTTFHRVISGARSRLEIAVSFLAMLELIKQRQIAATQENLFGPITIEPGDDWQDDQELVFDLEFEE